MPKKMWTEPILDFWQSKTFPYSKERFSLIRWFAGRLSFLFVIWLSGVLVYASDGLLVSYLSNPQLYVMVFVVGCITLLASNSLGGNLNWFFSWVRPKLKLSESEFEKFRDRVERYAYNFVPCLVIGLVSVICLTDAFEEFRQALARGLTSHVAWNFGFVLFNWLLIGTAIWTIFSTWLTVFFMSRQPLNLKLSHTTTREFRDLGMWALIYSSFYFLGLSILLVFPPLGIPSPATVPIEIVILSLLPFTLIGALGVLLPFYNIHQVFLQLKEQELQRLEEELDRLTLELGETQANCPAADSKDRITVTMARLLVLQTRERSVREAEEWPIGVGFFSTLASLVIIPSILTVVVEALLKTMFY